jgi:hypothetical protein
LEKTQLHNADWRVHTIKLADCIDNIPSIVEHDKNFAPRFVQEKLDLIPGLNKGNPNLYLKAMVMIHDAAEKTGSALDKDLKKFYDLRNKHSDKQ